MLLECHLLGKEERGCLCFNFKIEPKEKSFYLKGYWRCPRKKYVLINRHSKKLKIKFIFFP